MKRFLMVLMIMVMIPYVTTMAWTGRIGEADFTGFSEYGSGDEYKDRGETAEEEGRRGEPDGEDGKEGGAGQSGRYITVIRGGQTAELLVEDFLVHALAAQIPADYGPETLKAQAVLARTYIYREMDGAAGIPEEALDMDALGDSQMERLWGADYGKYIRALTDAVRATEGLYLAYQGEPAEAFFCRAASGMTRPGGPERPYLKQAESPGDLLADEFLSIAVFSPEDLAERVNSIGGEAMAEPGQLPEEIQVAERDPAGYVKLVQIGRKTYTGEEIQYALGLSSPCFSIDAVYGKIRFTCRGLGHGFGFSQAGAAKLEKEGKNFEELLFHYFQDVEIRNDGD